ncbi:hypothetical protein [Pseudomonas syringae pv. coryli]|uniref:hypothetical protein n=1 Tax=Pseudomonas syringae pv. coryli TaxID=317659 RepID=UPI003D27E1DE
MIGLVGLVAAALLWLSGTYAALVPYSAFSHAAKGLAIAVAAVSLLLAAQAWWSRPISRQIKAQAGRKPV